MANYNDSRLTAIEDEKQAELTRNDEMMDGMINDSAAEYQKQVDAATQYGEQQQQIQQEQTDFAIEKIEQQKEQTHKDYIKEQSAAFGDWQKQSDRYGASAEKMAAAGLSGSGYSESAQVSMYNTYQNRVATARDAYNRAILNYDNAIKDAMLQNNAALAEIAYNTLQTQLSLSLQGLQYKNTLLLQKAENRAAIDTRYWSKHQDVLSQINAEKALKLEREMFEYEKEQMALLEDGGEAAASSIYNGATAGVNNGATTISSTGNVYEKRNLNSIGLQGQSDETITALIESGALTPYRVGDVTKLKWNDHVLGSVKKENRLDSITATKNLLISKANNTYKQPTPTTYTGSNDPFGTNSAKRTGTGIWY